MIFEDEDFDFPFWVAVVIAPATVLVDCSPRRWVRLVGIVLTILLLPYTMVAGIVALAFVLVASAAGLLVTFSLWMWDAVTRLR